MTFTTDASVTISAARIALALTYQEGEVQLLPSVEMPEELQALRPSLDRVRCDLGSEPALFVAFEHLPTGHLSGHTLFFELGPDSFRIQQALWSEPWCIVGNEGELSAQGLLRPVRGSTGVQLLQFLKKSKDATTVGPLQVLDPGPQVNSPDAAALPNGFYAGRVFIFPAISQERQFQCHVPRGLESPIRKLFHAGAAQFLSAKRVWVRIAMPRHIPSLQLTLHSVHLHATSASNVECLNQTIQFDTHGFSIPLSREAGAERYLVAPLSIFGEADHIYIPDLSPSADGGVGRFVVRNGRINIQPARGVDGRPDQYVNVRIWSTSGPLANSVGPGKVTGFVNSAEFPGLQVLNPVSAAGGTSSEEYRDAYTRFGAALLSRDRIVTEADLIHNTRSFDRRVTNARIEPALYRTATGLQRLEKVIATVDRAAFIDPDIELRLLEEDLRQHLRQSVLHGTEIAVEFEAA